MSNKKLNRIVSLRYASALFDLAVEAKQVSAVEGELLSIYKSIEESEDFRKFIYDFLLSRKEKVSAVKALSNNFKLSKLTNNFLCVLADKRRLNLLEEIIIEFNKLIAKEKGEVTATVTVVDKIDDKQLERLKELILSSTGMKSVKLDIQQDQSIIGGLIIKIGSVVIDNSVQSKLNRLKRKLKEANSFSDTNAREVI